MPTDFDNNIRALNALRTKTFNHGELKTACENAVSAAIAKNPDPDHEDYDLEELNNDISDIIEIITNIASRYGKVDEGLISLNSQTKERLIRSIQTDPDVDLSDLSEAFQKFYYQEFSKFPPKNIQEYKSLVDFCYSDRSKVTYDYDDSDGYEQEVNIQDAVINSLQPERFLDEVITTDDIDSFQDLLEFDKLKIDYNLIVKLAIEKPKFLNELYNQKYKKSDKTKDDFKKLLDEITMRGHGSEIKTEINKHSSDLDKDFLDLINEKLLTAEEKHKIDSKNSERVTLIGQKQQLIDAMEKNEKVEPSLYKEDFSPGSNINGLMYGGIIGMIFVLAFSNPITAFMASVGLASSIAGSIAVFGGMAAGAMFGYVVSLALTSYQNSSENVEQQQYTENKLKIQFEELSKKLDKTKSELKELDPRTRSEDDKITAPETPSKAKGKEGGAAR
jgi:hypothetical protein